MSPVDARAVQLRTELLREWAQVVTLAERAASTDPGKDDGAAALVALSLDHAYQAFESLLVRVERALALPERRGSAWHAALLADAAEALPGLRPPVYPAEHHRAWLRLLRFWYFLRHADAVNLEPDELRTTTAHLSRAVAGTASTIAQMIATLSVTDA